MTDKPDKPVEGKDSLDNLGKSASRDSSLEDFYTWPEYAYVRKVEIECERRRQKAYDNLEKRLRREYGTSKNFLNTMRFFEKNNFIGTSSITEMKIEIISAIESDKNICMDIRDIDDDKVKGSS